MTNFGHAAATTHFDSGQKQNGKKNKGKTKTKSEKQKAKKKHIIRCSNKPQFNMCARPCRGALLASQNLNFRNNFGALSLRVVGPSLLSLRPNFPMCHILGGACAGPACPGSPLGTGPPNCSLFFSHPKWRSLFPSLGVFSLNWGGFWKLWTLQEHRAPLQQTGPPVLAQDGQRTPNAHVVALQKHRQINEKTDREQKKVEFLGEGKGSIFWALPTFRPQLSGSLPSGPTWNTPTCRTTSLLNPILTVQINWIGPSWPTRSQSLSTSLSALTFSFSPRGLQHPICPSQQKVGLPFSPSPPQKKRDIEPSSFWREGEAGALFFCWNKTVCRLRG